MRPHTHPLSFFAAILKMMAGLLVVSMWALASWAWDTTHWEAGPQYTLAKAMVPGCAPGWGLRPRYTEYSVMAPAELAGGSQERCAPSALCPQEEEGCHGDSSWLPQRYAFNRVLPTMHTCTKSGYGDHTGMCTRSKGWLSHCPPC